jgi:hypothetical protein
MFSRFINAAVAQRFTRGFLYLWKGEVRWTSWILATFLALAAITLMARWGNVSAAREEPATSSPPAAAASDVPPPAGARPGPGHPPPAAGTVPSTAPDPSALRTIGTLTAAHYFQTYLNIGFIADGKSKGTYSSDDARKVLRSVLSVVDSVDRQLESLGQRTLERDDCDSLDQMRAISALLRQQGVELQTYWDSGQEQDAARYESLRQNSYTAINKLMATRP